MTQFKKKGKSSGFEAGESRAEAQEQAASTEPDFSALEQESGISGSARGTDRIRKAGQSTDARPAAAEPGGIFAPDLGSEPEIEPAPAQPAEEAERKKRYYTPGEVMKKKGCIGCGGMVLAVPAFLALVALLVAVL